MSSFHSLESRDQATDTNQLHDNMMNSGLIEPPHPWPSVLFGATGLDPVFPVASLMVLTF